MPPAILIPKYPVPNSSSICISKSPVISFQLGRPVGAHLPPPPHQVPILMNDYSADLLARFAGSSGHIDDLLLETLAFAEARLLTIHPFSDFTGRVARLFLRELLRRLELPPVDLVPAGSDGVNDYLASLRSGDRSDWRPLMKIWERRFERFGDASS